MKITVTKSTGCTIKLVDLGGKVWLREGIRGRYYTTKLPALPKNEYFLEIKGAKHQDIKIGIVNPEIDWEYTLEGARKKRSTFDTFGKDWRELLDRERRETEHEVRRKEGRLEKQLDSWMDDFLEDLG